jgi:hypothetical protein
VETLEEAATPVRQCAYVLCARVFCFSLCAGSNIHEGRAHNKHASLFFKNKRLLSPAGLRDFFPPQPPSYLSAISCACLRERADDVFNWLWRMRLK